MSFALTCLPLFYTEYLTKAFTREGGRGRMLPHLSLKPKIMETPQLIIVHQNFIKKLVSS